MATVTEIDGNQTFATAQVLDASLFTIQADPNVVDSATVPHVTVNEIVESSGGTKLEYYQFTLTTAASVTFDIDYGYDRNPNHFAPIIGPGNDGLDSTITVYGSNQVEIGSNDDTGPTADPGSTLNPANFNVDSNLTLDLAAGTYFIKVGAFGGGIDPWFDYALHISTTGAGTTEVEDVSFGGFGQGYWKTHVTSWDNLSETPHVAGASFEATFGIEDHGGWSTGKKGATTPDVTLAQALGLQGSGENGLARAAVAALQNATADDLAPGTQYAFSEADIIAAVQLVFAGGHYDSDLGSQLTQVLEQWSTPELGLTGQPVSLFDELGWA